MILTGSRNSRNLRRRIAVWVGLFTAAVVLVFGATAWFLVGRSLQTAADSDLRATAEAVIAIGPSRITNSREILEDGDGPALSPENGRPAVPYIQTLDRNGVVLLGDLPVSDEAAAVARGEAEESIESIEVDGRIIRMLTVRLDWAAAAVGAEADVGALRVGSDITNTVDGLGRARVATRIAGVVAGFGAAALAWLLSRHLIAPVSAVADAADRVRRNDELPERLDGEGTDELGRLITSFNQMLDDVRHSRNQQRRLVADASHELRTPLASLRIKVEFIQSEPDLAVDERQRLLDGAVADLESLGDLVSELVELAAEGATPERPKLVELADVVEAEVKRFRATSGRTVELSTTTGVVETRPKQVVRALTNLLVNADRYSPADQPITVTQVGPRIEVRDRGPGIPPEERDRVFDRFYRGRAHQSTEGSGLGLSIVESVARANGGRVWIGDPDRDHRGAVVGFSAGPEANR